MHSARTGWALPIIALASMLLVAACTQPSSSATPVVEERTETASYKMKLVIGSPVVLPPDVQVMPGLTQIDRGEPVNHHLEIHFYDKSTGEVVTDLGPTLLITDETRGTARVIQTEPQSAFLLACVVAIHLLDDGHFGDNFYLPEGVYKFTALVGEDSAVFENVVVSDG